MPLANASEDKSGRLTSVDDLSSEEGRFVPIPLGVQERSLLAAIHELTLAGQFAERLVLLSAGRIAAEGGPGAILRADLLSTHYDAGIGV